MHKKGWMMTIAAVGFLIAIFFLIDYRIIAKDTLGGVYYGGSEAKLIKIYQKADEMSFNLNYFGSEAYKKSLWGLSDKAGWSKSYDIPNGCFINGFVLGVNKCRPDLREQLKKEFLENFNELINNYAKEDKKYKVFEDKEVIITDNSIEGEKEAIRLINETEEINVWVDIKPSFKVDLNDFDLFKNIWLSIEKCSIPNKFVDCFKSEGYKFNIKDLGGYFLIDINTGKSIFYRGEIKPLNIKFLVHK